MAAALILWSVIGIIIAGVLLIGTEGDTPGPLLTGFLCLVCGPLTFAIYLFILICAFLSKLDDKWFS